MDGQNMFT